MSDEQFAAVSKWSAPAKIAATILAVVFSAGVTVATCGNQYEGKATAGIRAEKQSAIDHAQNDSIEAVKVEQARIEGAIPIMLDDLKHVREQVDRIVEVQRRGR